MEPARIALMGIGLGGYLAPRAAAFEHRLAALIANDGMYTFHFSEKARAATRVAALCGRAVAQYAPKTLMRFTAADGAEEYCQLGALLLSNHGVFEWLDTTLHCQRTVIRKS